MNHMKNIILIGGLGIFLFVAFAGCVFSDTQNDSNDDIKPENYCNIPSDCSEKDLIHPMCVGNWTCVENQCGWKCNTQPKPQPPEDKPPTLTKETCESANGHWNECGSACRGAPPGTACIMMCVQYCECGGIAGFGCPQGYQCTDFLPKNAADAMGICKKID